MFYNETGTIGILLDAFTTNVSGSLYLTFAIIMVAIILLCVAFDFPMELVLFFSVPITLVFAAFDSRFYVILAIELIIMGWNIASAFLNK